MSVTYDLYYCVPRMWLVGYDSKGRLLTANEMKEDSPKKIETPKTPQKKKNNKTKMKKKLYETNDISRITTRVFDDNKTPKSDSYPEFISQVKKEDVVQSINFDVKYLLKYSKLKHINNPF